MRSPNDLAGRLVLAAGAILVAATMLPAHASGQAAWPNHPIRLIVPFPPGGSNDTIARVLADKFAARLGQPVVVENKTGAGGIIGTVSVAKSPPDGYTLLIASTTIATSAASGKKSPYDPLKDLQPIGEIGAGPLAIVVSNDLKVNTLQEFIALARAKPKSINYGSGGTGAMNHLGIELFASAAKIELVHVPYRGVAPAFTDLLAGNLQMLLPSLPSVTPYINFGKMRGLAITGTDRSPLAPELPTAAEAGLPGFELEVWWGLLGPAGLPAPVLKRLNDELNAALALTDVRDLLAREGATARPGTPEDLGKLIRFELKRWSQLIKDAHIDTE
jgi:tripartite-type tricarboxylate transporter receptor subunit TctC